MVSVGLGGGVWVVGSVGSGAWLDKEEPGLRLAH